jgi:hypothetical protein
MKIPISYRHRPTDVIQNAIDKVKPYLWANVTDSEPYRKYYLYTSPPSEASSRLHQLLTMYMVWFYLGSATRYRPTRYRDIMTGQYAPFLEELVTSSPRQFLYLMASEFAKQEVAKASGV